MKSVLISFLLIIVVIKTCDGQEFVRQEMINSTASNFWVENCLNINTDYSFQLISKYYLSRKKATLIKTDSISGTWSEIDRLIEFSNGFRDKFERRRNAVFQLKSDGRKKWKLSKRKRN